MDPQYQYFNHNQNYYNQNYSNYYNPQAYVQQQPYYHVTDSVDNNDNLHQKHDETVDEAEEDEGTWVLTDEAIALFAAGEERRKQST